MNISIDKYSKILKKLGKIYAYLLVNEEDTIIPESRP